MKLSPFWETNSCSATEEILSILSNPEVHYHVHKSLPLASILIQMNPVHIPPSYFSRIYFIIFLPSISRCPSGLFLSGFPSKTLLFHACHVPWPSHPLSLDTSNIWQVMQITELIIVQFSWASYYFIPLRSTYSSQHPVLKHPQPMYALPLI
jgi:hypothetical protein